MPIARPRPSLGFLQHASCSSRQYGTTPPPVHAGVYVPRKQPNVIDEESGTLYRVRSHGNRKLPMPPFMDARVVEAKTRHKQTKQAPLNAEQTQLQQDLAANVYAQAFATPVRYCGFTKARLPAHFLQGFTAEFVKSDEPDGKTRARSRIVPTAVKERAPTSQKHKFAHSATYVLNSAALLDHLDSTKGQWVGVPNERMYEQAMLVAGSKNAKRKDIWLVDPDMKGKTLSELIRGVNLELNRLMLRGLRGKVALGWERRIGFEVGHDSSSLPSQSSDGEVRALDANGERKALLSNAKDNFQLVEETAEGSDQDTTPEIASFVALQLDSGVATDGSLSSHLPDHSPVYDLAKIYGMDEQGHAEDSSAHDVLSKWLAITQLLNYGSIGNSEGHEQQPRVERHVLGIRKDRSTISLRMALERLNMFAAGV